MRKYLLAAAVAFSSLFGAVAVSSGQTASFMYNDGNGVPNAGTYTPGSSFTFSISLAFTPGGTINNLEGLSYWFEQQSPSAPFNFAITNRNLGATIFSDAQTPGITYPQNLTPQNASDLGALQPALTGVGAGTYFIADITISISASAAPGLYAIQNTTTGGKKSIITDDQGDTFAIPQALYSITVQAVPEPATWVAGGLVFATLALNQRRRIVRLGRRALARTNT